MDTVYLGAPKPATFPQDSATPLRWGDPPNFGPENALARMCSAVSLLYPAVLTVQFPIFFSIWPDSPVKRWSKDTEKQRRHCSDWVLSRTPATLSHMLWREHSSLPWPAAFSPSLNKVLHFQSLHLSWHTAEAASCCFLVCTGAWLRGHWDHIDVCARPDSATSRVESCGFGELFNLSESRFRHLLDEDNYAAYIISLWRWHNA